MNKISVDQALNIISKAVSRRAPAWLPPPEALGCQLAGDIVAKLDHPPFARSPLDGYAVRAADIEQADTSKPVRLYVTDRSYAGMPAQREIHEGEAIRIMTGGVIPRGADCVIRQEDTNLGENEVLFFARRAGKNNICAVGEDFHNGETLVPAGEYVTAATIALATAAGCETLFVFPKASAAILATGEELCESGKPLIYGQIYDSNTPYLVARLSELRVPVAKSARAVDRLEDIAQNLLALLETADVVFTTGGVSVGERDLLPEAIAQIGGEILFHGVAIKPGMPTLFAVVRGKPVLGLSGNPYSAAVAFELFGRVILAHAAGNNGLMARRQTAVMSGEYHNSGKYARYLRGCWQDGTVSMPRAQGNADIQSFVSSNCLVEVPPMSEPLKPGSPVTIYVIRSAQEAAGN